MPYSNFSLSRVKRDFNLTTVENQSFFPDISPIEPSFYLKEARSYATGTLRSPFVSTLVL